MWHKEGEEGPPAARERRELLAGQGFLTCSEEVGISSRAGNLGPRFTEICCVGDLRDDFVIPPAWTSGAKMPGPH